MSDIVSKILNISAYENNYKIRELELLPLEKCEHEFNCSSATDDGIAICLKCEKNWNELRSQ